MKISNEDFVKVKVYPSIPKGYIKGDPERLRKIQQGISLYFTKNTFSHGFFNTGFEAFLEGFRKGGNEYVLPPLWAFMHAIITNDEVVENIFGNSSIREKSCVTPWNHTTTSTIWYVRKKEDTIDIAHQVINKPHYHVINQTKGVVDVDTEKYGLAYSVPISECPQYEIGLDRLISDHNKIAQKLFLMDDTQLEKLLKRCKSFSDNGNFYFGQNIILTEPRAFYLFGNPEHEFEDEFGTIYSHGMEVFAAFVDTRPPGLIFGDLK